MESIGKTRRKLAWPTFSTIWASKTAWVAENVGQANFFHFFHELLRESFGIIEMVEKVEKVVKNNFFHDFGLQNSLSRGKSCF